ncbi:hypothetical protein K0M31_016053 [Melipona bicolor]|uniref:Uncharacterized protein n=1 Tax=Melipona bicolor TaxID=60889 RepID=A0AA40G6B7_9HYME|nr:hypothetical protein K0M31_016053 [Melipona bicolor]
MKKIDAAVTNERPSSYDERLFTDVKNLENVKTMKKRKLFGKTVHELQCGCTIPQFAKNSQAAHAQLAAACQLFVSCLPTVREE